MTFRLGDNTWVWKEFDAERHVLKFTWLKQEAKQCEISSDTTFGQSPSCTIVILDDCKVAPIQAAIIVKAGVFTLQDLAKNGL